MANWRSRLSGLASGLFGRAKKAPELSSSVVKHDRFDDGVLMDLTDRAKLFATVRANQPVVDLDQIKDEDGNVIALTEKQRGKVEQYVAWEDLFDDIFRVLHTYHEPTVLPDSEVKPSRELNRRIVQQLIANEDFAKLRPDTRHAPIESAFTAISMADRISATLQTELHEFVKRAKEMSELEDQMGPGGAGGLGGAGGGGGGAGGGGGGGKKQPDIFEQKHKQGGGSGDPSNQPQTQGQQGPAQLPGAPDPNKSQDAGQGGDTSHYDQIAQDLANAAYDQQQQGLGTAVMQAINNSLKDGKDAADAIGGLPGFGQGAEQRMNPDQMIELAKKWRESPILRNVAQMTGRLQRDMRQKRARRVVGGTEEIVSVTVGDDLPVVLPHEMAMLRHPILKREFQRKYHEKTLLQYETEGTESAGRGPIVVCLDGSGSMSGMPNEWARSVALALVTIAKREKRDAAVIEFSSAGQIAKWDFLKKERVMPEKVLDFVTHFFGGGTRIVEGMSVAKSFIETRPEFKKGDIVLITDGGDHFNEERDGSMRDELRRKGVRIHGVSIGFEAGSNAYLKNMCDSVVSAYDMAGSNEATTHLAEAIT